MLISNNGGEYLDVTKLNFLSETKAKAFVIGSKPRIDKNGQPFIMFTFRDVNKKIIYGFMFDIKHVTDLGYEIPKLVKNVAEVTYFANNLQGGINLRVTGFEIDNDPKHLRKFLAVNQQAESQHQEYSKILKDFGLETQLSAEAIHGVALGIGNGSVGMYMKFSMSIMNAILQFDGESEINTKDLLECTDRVLEGYRKFLNVGEGGLGHLKMNTMKLAASEAKNMSSPALNNIVVDALESLYRDNAPEHLYSHLMVKTIRNQLNLISLIGSYSTVFPGQAVQVGDDVLARY